MNDYKAPWWLPGQHAETLYPLARKGDIPRYRRVREETPDGDFVDIDWLDAPSTNDAPLLLLFHGLEGSSRSHYARSLMRAVAARQWRGAVIHFRGCSGHPNRLPRAYHSGDSAEIDWMLARMRTLSGGCPLFAAGVSLGGNALLKWLGEQEATAGRYVDSAAAICPPLDLTLSGQNLARGFNRLYTQHFLRTLIPKAVNKAEAFPNQFDLERIRHARSLEDFDDAYTAPAHGFADVFDYWRRASAKPWLGAIQLPTLLISASNDPFVPREALPALKDLGSGLDFECPARGGHVGFVQGPWPGKLDWLPQRLLAHFDRQR